MNLCEATVSITTRGHDALSKFPRAPHTSPGNLLRRSQVAGTWKAGFDEARPLGDKPSTHTLDQHAANLGG
jgi:hypothetical protein